MQKLISLPILVLNLSFFPPSHVFLIATYISHIHDINRYVPILLPPGCPQGSSTPLITRLFHCHKQLCRTIITPWYKIFKTTTGVRKLAADPPVVTLREALPNLPLVTHVPKSFVGLLASVSAASPLLSLLPSALS